MGVTIHFEGRLASDAAFDGLVGSVEAFARDRGWQHSRFDIPSATLARVANEQDVDYVGPTRGVVVMPHASAEPLRFEFDRTLYVQEYCKTQFAGPDTHKLIVSLLEQIAPLFISFAVFDEGEFWETHDDGILIAHIAKVDALIEQHLTENPCSVGPVRLPSGRIVDITEG